MERTIKEPVKQAAIAPVSLDDFLRGLEPQTVVVELPELGEGRGIKIRSLSVADREKMRSACTNFQTGRLNVDQFQLMAILHCAVEPKLSPEHLARMKDGNARILDRISNAIFEMSKLDATEEALKKD
jgi:hypothetical protein